MSTDSMADDLGNPAQHESVPRPKAAQLLRARAKQYAVLTVLGPRQSGKTTLCQATFAHKPCLNLEQPDVREFARSDPKAFLAGLPDGAVLDEIQHVPELLSWIQVIVDADTAKRKGLFVLTGSHQLALNAQITQSLAGRTAIVTLLPLSMAELAASPRHASLAQSADALMLHGGYPRIHGEGLPPDVMLADYFATYVERDARQLLALRQVREFSQCVRLMAGRVGQLQNHASLGSDLGVSSHTIRQWISVLEASFIVFALPPWFSNIGKRLIKAPKYYFHDVGLACWLLGIRSTEQLALHPLRGALFENLCISEIVKAQTHIGATEALYFFRDTNGVEVDLLRESGDGIDLVEIKAAQTLSSSQFKGLNAVSDLLDQRGLRVRSKNLLYGGRENQSRSNAKVLGFANAGSVFDDQKRGP